MTARNTPAPPSGRGDGTFTEDGCPVEIYAALPPAGEAEIVHAAVPAGASVLELGCGTGRISDRLARLGHRVVGVDSSAAMLSHLIVTEGVQSDIEALSLSERFDAVLLASHLVNTEDPIRRAEFLAAARRHLVEGGWLVLQRHAPGYRPQAAATLSGDVELELTDVVDHGEGVFSATLVHRWNGLVAEQDFSTHVLGDAALSVISRSAGFELVDVLTVDARWVLARARTTVAITEPMACAGDD